MTTNQTRTVGGFFNRQLKPYRSDVAWGWLRMLAFVFLLGVACSAIARHVFGG